MREFILLESGSFAGESFDSREELALELLKRLLEDDELHIRVEANDEGDLILEMM